MADLGVSVDVPAANCASTSDLDPTTGSRSPARTNRLTSAIPVGQRLYALAPVFDFIPGLYVGYLYFATLSSMRSTFCQLMCTSCVASPVIVAILASIHISM